MKRETRLNLIFIAAFLAISLPGAVILFKKKLDPRSTTMSMPDAVRTRIPYMTPLGTSSEVKRFVPPLTGQWIERLAGAQVLLRDGLPVMSDDYLLQVVSIRPNATQTEAELILWDSRASADVASLEISTGGPLGRVISAQTVLLPPDVRDELLNYGYPQPPNHIIWIKAALSMLSERQTVELRYRVGQSAATTSVNLFTR